MPEQVVQFQHMEDNLVQLVEPQVLEVVLQVLRHMDLERRL